MIVITVKTGNVSLIPEVEAFINDRTIRSASEVVRAASPLLEDDERQRETRSARQSL